MLGSGCSWDEGDECTVVTMATALHSQFGALSVRPGAPVDAQRKRTIGVTCLRRAMQSRHL
jgi:hypothetical protein